MDLYSRSRNGRRRGRWARRLTLEGSSGRGERPRRRVFIGSAWRCWREMWQCRLRAGGRSDEIDSFRRRGHLLAGNTEFGSVDEEVLHVVELRPNVDDVTHDVFEVGKTVGVCDLRRRRITERGIDGGWVRGAGPSEEGGRDFIDEVLLKEERTVEVGDVLEDMESGSTEVVEFQLAVSELKESVQHIPHSKVSACGLTDSGVVVRVGEQAFAVHVHVVEARVALVFKVTKETGSRVYAFNATDGGDVGPAFERCAQGGGGDGLFEVVEDTLDVFKEDVVAVNVGTHGDLLVGAVRHPLVVGP